MADLREAIIISTNGKTVDIRPKGGNSTLRNIPYSGGNAEVGQTVFYQTLAGRRLAFSSPSESDIAGSSGGSLNIYNTTSTNIEGASPQDILSSATYRGDKVSSETLLKTSASGFLALASSTIGNCQLSYSPTNGWRQGSNLALVSTLSSALAFATSTGVTGITGTADGISVATDFGFGTGITTLSGVAVVSPYGGALGVNQFPSAPLTGAGERDQLNLVNTTGQRSASFSVDEAGNLSITPQNGKTLIAGQTKTQHLISDTASISRLRAGSLLVDRQSVLCGETIAAERGAFIAFDFTIPAAGKSSILIVEEPIESTSNIFRDGAFVLISKVIWTDSTTYIRKKCWGKVTFRRRLPGGSPPMQEYVFERDLDIPGDLEVGGVITHDGPSNIATQFGKDDGLYMITTTGGTSTPSVKIFQWTTHPETGIAKLETSADKVEVETLSFTKSGISAMFGPRLYFGADPDNQYYYSVGIETQASEAVAYGGSTAFIKAWDFHKTKWAGIKASMSFPDYSSLTFNADVYGFSGDSAVFTATKFSFASPTEFTNLLTLPAVNTIPHPWGAERISRLRIDLSSGNPSALTQGDIWLLDGGLKIYNNGAVRNVIAPATIPVLPTGAGKTVDDVISALQALGLVTQS